MNVICSESALRALHQVLVRARFESYEGRDPKTVGDVMDVAEYLVTLRQNHEGRSEAECLAEFRLGLHDIETRFAGFEGLLAAFEVEPQAHRAGHDLAKTAHVRE